ncbi:MAG: AAA family ATPase [Desulfobulbaceae bacterium]|nr:AAA family ATPase [Desulfobulbaceae bacterium]
MEGQGKRKLLAGIERIILTGFRATGKSSVGRELSRRLEFDFIDTDILLGRQTGCSVAEFVARHDWEAFRALERTVLAGLVDSKKVVIATGGGAVLHHDVWKRLRQHSVVIWLQADVQTVRQRLSLDSHSETQRPSLSGSDPQREIDTLLAEREPHYRSRSDFAVNTIGRTPEELAEEIMHHLDIIILNF